MHLGSLRHVSSGFPEMFSRTVTSFFGYQFPNVKHQPTSKPSALLEAFHNYKHNDPMKMCMLIEVVHMGCGCLTERIVWLACRDSGPQHFLVRNPHKEYVSDMCGRCITITNLGKELAEGRLDLAEYEIRVADVMKGMVKASVRDINAGRR